jgi:glucosyltransferase
MLSLIVIIEKVFNNVPVQGYTSLAFLILFLGGIQLFSMGVLGEYVGKIMLETKGRPLYIIRETFPEAENRGKD